MTTATRRSKLERRFPHRSNKGDELRIEFTPRVSILGDITEMMESFGKSNGIPNQQIFMINLEIDELITNYVRHSLHKVDQPRIEVSVRAEASKVILTVLDTGPPFNPADAPPPDLSGDLDNRAVGGVGLHLVSSYCDRMRHEVVDGFNRVTIEHDLKNSSDDDQNEEHGTEARR